MNREWTAKWVGPEKEDGYYPVIFKDFYVDDPVKKATLYITGIGMFEAYINGVRVGSEYLTPYQFHPETGIPYYEYDVTEMLLWGKDSDANSIDVFLGDGWKSAASLPERFALKAEIEVEVYKQNRTEEESSEALSPEAEEELERLLDEELFDETETVFSLAIKGEVKSKPAEDMFEIEEIEDLDAFLEEMMEDEPLEDEQDAPAEEKPAEPVKAQPAEPVQVQPAEPKRVQPTAARGQRSVRTRSVPFFTMEEAPQPKPEQKTEPEEPEDLDLDLEIFEFEDWDELNLEDSEEETPEAVAVELAEEPEAMIEELVEAEPEAAEEEIEEESEAVIEEIAEAEPESVEEELAEEPETMIEEVAEAEPETADEEVAVEAETLSEEAEEEEPEISIEEFLDEEAVFGETSESEEKLPAEDSLSGAAFGTAFHVEPYSITDEELEALFDETDTEAELESLLFEEELTEETAEEAAEPEETEAESEEAAESETEEAEEAKAEPEAEAEESEAAEAESEEAAEPEREETEEAKAEPEAEAAEPEAAEAESEEAAESETEEAEESEAAEAESEEETEPEREEIEEAEEIDAELEAELEAALEEMDFDAEAEPEEVQAGELEEMLSEIGLETETESEAEEAAEPESAEFESEEETEPETEVSEEAETEPETEVPDETETEPETEEAAEPEETEAESEAESEEETAPEGLRSKGLAAGEIEIPDAVSGVGVLPLPIPIPVPGSAKEEAKEESFMEETAPAEEPYVEADVLETPEAELLTERSETSHDEADAEGEFQDEVPEAEALTGEEAPSPEETEPEEVFDPAILAAATPVPEPSQEITYVYDENQVETFVIATDESWSYYGSDIEYSGIGENESFNRIFWNERENPEKEVRLLDLDLETFRNSMPPVLVKDRIKVKEVRAEEDGSFLLDFGERFHGFVQFESTLSEGDRVELEYKNDPEEKGRSFVYVSDGVSEEVCPHFTFFEGRYVKMTGLSEAPDPEAFTGCALYCDLPRTGYLEFSREDLNERYLEFLKEQKRLSLVLPEDPSKPSIYAFSTAAAYNMNVQSFLLDERKKLRKETEPKAAAETALLIWNLYMMYGDEAILRENYGRMKEWSDSVDERDRRKGEKHYLYDFESDYADLPAMDPETDPVFLASCYYYECTRLTGLAAKEIGNDKDAFAYARKARKIRQAILEEYFTGTGRLALDTQAAYVTALRFHICADEEKTAKAFAERLKKDGFEIKCTPAEASGFSRVLAECGMPDLACDLLLENVVTEDDGAVEFLYKELAGIQPEEPGFAAVRIAPVPDPRIRYCFSTLKIPAGDIISVWNINDQGALSFHFEIPQGIEATIALPYYPVCAAGGNEVRVRGGSFDYSYMPSKNMQEEQTENGD